MIAENVVFVDDNDGNKYYIPRCMLEDWELVIDSDYFYNSGVTPYYAVPVKVECFVVDIREVL